MNLVIVESPTKARTLGRFLGEDYEVVATMGHVVDLPKSKLGIDVEHDFKPEYVTLEKKAETLSALKRESKKAEKIYLATDPDREGEAIAKHVYDALCSNDKLQITNDKWSRVVFHEITESAVKQALENPRDIDLKLYDAQQARRVLDRLVGYKLSPLLWKKVRRGLSAGRVQTVAVRLIVEREREIEVFKPVEYWEIAAEVKSKRVKEHESGSFLVALAKVNDRKAEVRDSDSAKVIVGDLEKAKYTVESVEKREIPKRPYAPFTTSTMAQAGARTFYWSAKKTMSVAQKLYEEGLITYHRTDSLNLNKDAVIAARNLIESKFGKNFVPEKPRFYKIKSKVAQEAHEAIRPTDVNVISNTEHVTRVGNDAKKLYDLIWRRFVSCQMAEAVYDETRVSVHATRDTQHDASYTLTASGQIMKFQGWRKVYDQSRRSREQESEIWEQILPEVFKGDALEKLKVLSEQKFTQPLPRYNEASLIKTLEKLGIGRPSTYAPTISTIQDRQYINREEGKFFPTPVGTAVNDFLMQYFPDVFDYQFTAGMEDSLDKIADGKREWVPVIREFWNPFEKKLEGVEEKAKRVKIEVEKTGKKCPKCKIGDQVIRVGRFGKFLSCSTFPECDWKETYVEKINMKCPDCKEGDVIIRKTRKGRSFYGCSRYPECKWASWKKPTLPKGENKVSNPVTQ